DFGDARHLELLRLALDRVHMVACGIGMGMGGTARDPGPLRPRPGPEEAKVPTRAVRGLEIVDAREALVAQAPPECQPLPCRPERGPRVEPDLVDIARGPRERCQG